MSRVRALAVELWLPVLVLAAWYAYSGANPSFYFPPLADILSALRDNWFFDHLGSDAVPSLVNLGIGLVIATVVGISAGVALGLVPVLREAFSPTIEFLRSVPPVALIPMAIVLLGIGSTEKIALIAFGTLWPILLNTQDGVRGVDPMVRDFATAYRLRRRDFLLRVVLPAASPQIVVGLRIALALGVSLIAFSEMIAATEGIGFFTLQALRSFSVTDMWSGMVFLGLLGYVLNVLFRVFERQVLSWHVKMHDTSGA